MLDQASFQDWLDEESAAIKQFVEYHGVDEGEFECWLRRAFDNGCISQVLRKRDEVLEK